MSFSDLYRWSSPSNTLSVDVYGSDSLLPYRYSEASEINSLVVESGFRVEFTNTIPTFQNTRGLSVSVRVLNANDGTESADPTDAYYFSLVPQGEEDVWVLSNTSTWQAPTPLDVTVLPGQMQRIYTLKAKVERQSGAIEIAPVVTTVTIDEVAPITTAVQTSGTYSPNEFRVLLDINDFAPTTTYYTTDGNTPTQASNIYDANGISIATLDVPVVVKYFSVDAAGNIETPNWVANENSVEITLDSIPPIVTIDSVEPAALVIGTISNIAWHVNEFCPSARIELGGGGIVGNGALIHTAAFVPANTSQTLQIPATSLPNGTSTIYIFATDQGNNTGVASFQLEFENQIPVIDIYEVCRHTLASNDSGTIIWKTNIAGEYTIRLGGQNPNEGTLLGSGTAEANKIIESQIVSSQLVANILNEVRIYLESASGNIGFVSINMSVDTLPPTTTVNIPGNTGPFLSPFNIRIDAIDSPPAGVTTDFGLIHGGYSISSPLISNSNYSNYYTGLDQVATPVISPVGGIKSGVFYATISCSTVDATIYMTLNGEDPTVSSMVYGGAFLVDRSLTIKAIAVKAGMADSAISAVEYTMTIETVATPVITGNGTGVGSVIVDIASSTNGAEIRYTTDGTLPTALSTLFISPFTLTGTSAIEVQALAIKTGMYNSNIATATFLVPLGLNTPSVINITTNSASIVITSTRATDAVLEYSNDPYLNSPLTVPDNTLSTSHSISLSSLQENTTYYYRVRATDSEGIVVEQSPILSFNTNSIADAIPPVISGLAANVVSDHEINITWTTDELASSIVIYDVDAAFNNPVELVAQNTVVRVSSHSYTVTNLEADKQYWFRVKSLDAAGNQSVSGETIVATTMTAIAPLVTNLSIRPYRTTCVFEWETNKPTAGYILYGISPDLGLTAVPLIPGYKTNHEMIIEGLTPDRQYYFVIAGSDELDNAITFSAQTFNSAPNRDTRLIIYANTDGTVPTTSQHQYRVVGNPFLYNVVGDTIVKYFAVDGFGNQQAVQTELYAFDVNAPVITVDWMEPLLLNATMHSTIRFKSSEDCHYVITNQAGTILATNQIDYSMNYSLFAFNEAGDVSEPASLAFVASVLPAEMWTEVDIAAELLEEGYNHINLAVTDKYGNTTNLAVGHLIKDTIAPIVQPDITPGYYNSVIYVSLIPANLRDDEKISIYYTTDGSLPTFDSDVGHGQVYSILVANTTTVRWFAVDEAGNVSGASYATYVIDKQAPLVYATPASGAYDEVIDVELKANEAATIFYTLNGTLPSFPPNEHTSIYTQPIQILQNTAITCFARDLAGNVSEFKVFEYEIQVLHDKKFKKVIAFQDKMFLETEFNEAQDNINRRIEEMAKELVGDVGIVRGFDLVPSNFPGSFEFYLLEGKAYIYGKFATIMRQDQGFVPSPLEVAGTKTYHVLLMPNEPIFRPSRPGQPGWEEDVPDITTYRLEEGYVIQVVENYPDISLEPYAELYDIIRPANASSIADCTIIDKRRFFKAISEFQSNIGDVVSDLQANLLALGMEVESYKLRNVLGLKNAFVDTFESTKDVDLGKSKGYRYTNTRFEL